MLTAVIGYTILLFFKRKGRGGKVEYNINNNSIIQKIKTDEEEKVIVLGSLG